MREGLLEELANGVRLPGGHDVVVRRVLLQHPPHRLDVVLGEAPVALGVQVAEVKLAGEPVLDRGHAHRDLAGDEVLAPAGRLVVEQDAVGGVDAVALAIVHRDPVAEDLGRAVGRARVERGLLRLRGLLDEAVHLGAPRLVDTRLEVDLAHGVEQPQDAQRGHVGRVLRHLEGDLDVALRGQVVDLVGSDQLQRAHEAVLVHEVAVVEDQAVADVVDAPGVERAAPAHEPVDLVPLLEEELGEVGAVLARDPGDERLARGHADLLPCRAKRPILSRRSGGGGSEGGKKEGIATSVRVGVEFPDRSHDRSFPPLTTWLPPNHAACLRKASTHRHSR